MSAELSTNQMMAKILKDGMTRRGAAARAHSLQRLCCAAAECALLATELDKRADNASESDHQSGEYGNLRHDSEVMRLAQRIFEREQQHNARITDAAPPSGVEHETGATGRRSRASGLLAGL